MSVLELFILNSRIAENKLECEEFMFSTVMQPTQQTHFLSKYYYYYLGG